MAEYEKMIAAGILDEDDRVELIEGEIVELPPIGGPHMWCVNRLNQLFCERLGKLAAVSVQNPFRLDEWSEPQPDLALLRSSGPEVPSAPDVALAVEVSDTTLRHDRDLKVPKYARSGIPESWIVDLAGDVIHVHRDPCPQGYSSTRMVRRGETLSPLSFPQVQFTADEILG